MITKAAAGVWEISIPAPLPCSASEQLIGYARYTAGSIEVRVSHLIGRTEHGVAILPVSEDQGIRDALARALVWRLLSDVITVGELAPLQPESPYRPTKVPGGGGGGGRTVPLNAGSFDGGDLDGEAPDYSVFLPEGE